MSSRLRKTLALAITTGLALLVASSLWHHDHSPALAGINSDDRLIASAPDSHSSDYCPVCLSQRLLTHTCTQSVAETPSTVICSYCTISASILPVSNYAFHSEARAPPLC
jgi:hypothetical protein